MPSTLIYATEIQPDLGDWSHGGVKAAGAPDDAYDFVVGTTGEISFTAIFPPLAIPSGAVFAGSKLIVYAYGIEPEFELSVSPYFTVPTSMLAALPLESGLIETDNSAAIAVGLVLNATMTANPAETLSFDALGLEVFYEIEASNRKRKLDRRLRRRCC